MGFVAFDGKHIANKSIDEATFRKIAEYLGMAKPEVDSLMADHPKSIFIHRGPGAGNNPSDPGGGGSGSGGSSSGGGSGG